MSYLSNLIIEDPVNKFMDTSILEPAHIFNWTSFHSDGQHHNSGTFTVTKRSNNYFEMLQTSENDSTYIPFIGAIISDKIDDENGNFVFISPGYEEVWICSYMDEHTIRGTVLDGTFILTY